MIDWKRAFEKLPREDLEHNREVIEFINKLVNTTMQIYRKQGNMKKHEKTLKALLRKLPNMRRDIAQTIYPTLMQAIEDFLPPEMAQKIKEECTESILELELSK